MQPNNNNNKNCNPRLTLENPESQSVKEKDSFDLQLHNGIHSLAKQGFSFLETMFGIQGLDLHTHLTPEIDRGLGFLRIPKVAQVPIVESKLLVGLWNAGTEHQKKLRELKELKK